MKIFKKILIILLVIVVAAIYSYGIWPRAIYDTSVSSSAYEVTKSLEQGCVLEQKFVCQTEGLCGITIKLTKQTNESIGLYEWKVVETKIGKVVGQGIIDESSTETKDFESKNAQKQGTVKLDFTKQKYSVGNTYLLTIKPQNVSENEAVAAYVTEKGDNDGALTIQGEKLDKVSVVKLQYQRFNIETFIVFLGIALYLLAFVRFMYKLFR